MLYVLLCATFYIRNVHIHSHYVDYASVLKAVWELYELFVDVLSK